MAASSSSSADIFIDEHDLPFEEDILRNPYNVKSWLRYIDQKRKVAEDDSSDKNLQQFYLVYERAVNALPGSYKLWNQYLVSRTKQTESKFAPDSVEVDKTASVYERALSYLHKMPRIWLNYIEFLSRNGRVRHAKRTCDRALRSLPCTQHGRVWPVFLRVADELPEVPRFGMCIYRRYLKFDPDGGEAFVEYLLKAAEYDEAAYQLAELIQNERFESRRGRTRFELWSNLCELVCKQARAIRRLDVDAIVRQGIRKYPDQTGPLWNSLAEYYIRTRQFERARDVYEEAIASVTTVRDFSQLYDAFSLYAEQAVQHAFSDLSKQDEREAKRKAKKKSQTEESNAEEQVSAKRRELEAELDLRMARLETLLERRPLLLNSVLLRQNPHNVHEWLKRVELLDESATAANRKQKTAEQIDTFSEALRTVDPLRATGKYPTLWTSFAKFYESHNQMEDARLIFEKAVEATYKTVDDLSAVYCEWVEMELRNSNLEGAKTVAERGTRFPEEHYRIEYHDASMPAQKRLFKNIKIWSLRVDLAESFSDLRECITVYDTILQLRIATPQIVLNYASYLEENERFEQSFQVFEKGVALFKWPTVFDIWNTYLAKFIDRYGGSKLERARDLFEQCLDKCPAELSKNIFLLYAKLEQRFGLARRALQVYERACKTVPAKERFELYNIYIKHAAEMFGVTHTRAIYEQAIEALHDEEAREMCLRFADMERKLGEVNRARALFAYCSQMCDPRTSGNFWETWKEFEIKHGNEDTLKEMLRVRRSVQATYNTQANFMITQISAAQQLAEQRDEEQRIEGSAMSKLEERASLKDRVEAAGGLRFVRSTLKEDQIGTETRAANVSQVTSNPNEINLDFDDEDDEQQKDKGDEPSVAVVKKRVPDTVFGGVKHPGQSAEDDDADDLAVVDEEDAPEESANKSENQRGSPQKRKAQQPRAQKTFKKRRRNIDGRDNSHFSYD